MYALYCVEGRRSIYKESIVFDIMTAAVKRYGGGVNCVACKCPHAGISSGIVIDKINVIAVMCT